MKYLLTLIAGLLLFTSCKDDKKDDNSSICQRTLICYVCGDNNLSSDAKENITSLILQGSKEIGKDNMIVVVVDNQKTNPTLIHIRNGEYTKSEPYDTDFYMTDPEKIRQILTYIMNEYKSNSYALLLWGHSTGWMMERDTIAYANTRGYGSDNIGETGSGIAKWINYTAMGKVFSQLPAKFDVIIGDVCLLQCVEVAYELRNYTNYIVGAPSEVPGYGLPYDSAIKYMFGSSEEDYKVLANAIYNNTKGSYQVPTSLVKTSALEDLRQATLSLVKSGKFEAEHCNFSNTIYYYRFEGCPIMYDMQNIMLNNLDEGSYTEWKKAFDNAVVYRVAGSQWNTGLNYPIFNDFTVSEENYGGLSMFVPNTVYNTMYTYKPNDDIRHYEWNIWDNE